jgi:plasmid stability protein
MSQITIRASDELIDRVRISSVASGRSMNEFVTFVLDAATDHALAGTEAARIRERLAQVGLLALSGRQMAGRPSSIADASRRAAKGKSLAEHVADAR